MLPSVLSSVLTRSRVCSAGCADSPLSAASPLHPTPQVRLHALPGDAESLSGVKVSVYNYLRLPEDSDEVVNRAAAAAGGIVAAVGGSGAAEMIDGSTDSGNGWTVSLDTGGFDGDAFLQSHRWAAPPLGLHMSARTFP